MLAREHNLLIVDDDANQATLFALLLAEIGHPHMCHHVSSGAKALQFLRRNAPFQNAPRPHLIVLDVNMPGEDGCDTLRIIKSDPELRCIPVIMFSASLDDADVLRSYKQHANAYVQKPSDLESSLSIVRHIESFWLQTAHLPV